jgi:hypothetical protein
MTMLRFLASLPFLPALIGIAATRPGRARVRLRRPAGPPRRPRRRRHHRSDPEGRSGWPATLHRRLAASPARAAEHAVSSSSHAVPGGLGSARSRTVRLAAAHDLQSRPSRESTPHRHAARPSTSSNAKAIQRPILDSSCSRPIHPCVQTPRRCHDSGALHPLGEARSRPNLPADLGRHHQVR